MGTAHLSFVSLTFSDQHAGDEGHEGDEGDEESHEAPRDEGSRGGCTSDEGDEGDESHEGHEESHEGNEGHESNEGHEEVSGCKCCSVLVLGNGSGCLASSLGGVPRLARLYNESFVPSS